SRSPSPDRVEPVDSADHPIQGAEITLSRGLKEVVARGQSDARGQLGARSLERAQVDDARLGQPVRRVASFQRADHASGAPGLRALDDEPRQLVDMLVLEREAA